MSILESNKQLCRDYFTAFLKRDIAWMNRHISPSFLPRSKNDRPGFSSLTCSRTVLENSTNEVAGFFGPPWGILLRRFRLWNLQTQIMKWVSVCGRFNREFNR